MGSLSKLCRICEAPFSTTTTRKIICCKFIPKPILFLLPSILIRYCLQRSRISCDRWETSLVKSHRKVPSLKRRKTKLGPSSSVLFSQHKKKHLHNDPCQVLNYFHNIVLSEMNVKKDVEESQPGDSSLSNKFNHIFKYENEIFLLRLQRTNTLFKMKAMFSKYFLLRSLD